MYRCVNTNQSLFLILTKAIFHYQWLQKYNIVLKQVKCGQLARRKRSGDLRIDFDISAEFDNASFAESFARFRRHQSDIVDKIIEEKSSGVLDFNISTYGVMEMKDIENFDVVLQCPERTVPSYKTTSCGNFPFKTTYIIPVVLIIRYWPFVCFLFYKVECAAGTFFNTTTDTCEMCPRGSYQTISGQISCLSCPFGQTTKSKGAQNISQCIGKFFIFHPPWFL